MKKGVVFFLFGMFGNFLFSQNIPLEIINVDQTSVDETLYPGAQKLVGNIHFKQDDAHLYCDSGFFYPAENRLLAQGKVRIIQGDFKATCFELNYSGNSRLAIMQGGVQLNEGNQRLRTQKVDYRTDTKIASYKSFGQIDAPGIRASSDSGYYFRNESTLLLIGHAKLNDQKVSVKADTIGYNQKLEELRFYKNTNFEIEGKKGTCNGGYYSKNTQIGQLIHRVLITDSSGNQLDCDTLNWNNNLRFQEVLGKFSSTDSSGNQTIWGNYLKRWEKNDSFFVTKNVLVKLINGEDTTFLFTDTLTGNEQGYHAFSNNRIKTDSLVGICGSLIYEKRDSTLHLGNNPMLWNREFQICAKQMIQKKKGNLQLFDCFDSCFVYQWVDCCHTSQIKSDTLFIQFSDSNSRKMSGLGNVTTVYYDVEGKKIERETEVSSKSMNLSWENGKINVLSYQKDPKIRIQKPPKDGKILPGFSANRSRYFEELTYWKMINRIY